MDKLSLEHHIKHLEEHHTKLEKQIAEGFSHYLDDEHLGKLKHERLITKRQIEDTREKLAKL